MGWLMGKQVLGQSRARYLEVRRLGPKWRRFFSGEPGNGVTLAAAFQDSWRFSQPRPLCRLWAAAGCHFSFRFCDHFPRMSHFGKVTTTIRWG